MDTFDLRAYLKENRLLEATEEEILKKLEQGLKQGLSAAKDLENEPVSKKEFRLFQLSPLAKPTTRRPVYMLDRADHIVSFLGRQDPVVDVDYIRIPNLVNWTYVVVGGKALHNSTAGDIGHFELHPSEETDLVLKILTLAGFTLKDPNLYQAAASEDMKNTQQEKQ